MVDPAASPGEARTQAPHATSGAVALLVFGMHRSGTSALTRVLSLLGADLPKNLMPPASGNNATGFWESEQGYQLNEALLQSAGSAWDDWRLLGRGDLSANGQALAQVQQLIRDDFDQSPFFVLKDPRLCRLAPLWLEALDHMQIETRAILALRNPLEVAESLRVRDELPLRHSLLLWLSHMLEAEHHTRGLPRAFVRYEELLNDWRGVLARAATATGSRWPREADAAASDIEQFLSRPLRHHQIPDDQLLDDPDIHPWVRRGYAQLRALVDAEAGSPQAAAAQQELDAIREAFLTAQDALAIDRTHPQLHSARERQRWEQRQQELQATAAEYQKQRDNWQREAEQQRAVVAGFQEERQQWGTQQQELNEQLVALQVENAALGEQTRRQDEALQDSRQELNRAQEERERLSQRIETLQQSLNKAASTVRRTRELGMPTPPKAHLPGRDDHEITASGWLSAFAHLFLRAPRLALRELKLIRRLWLGGIFDAQWLLANGEGTDHKPGALLADWLAAGWREGKQPGPFFDPHYYLASNPDVATAGINPLQHYLQWGEAEGRAPNPYFDPGWYRGKNPDVARSGIGALEHYCLYGRHEGRMPGPLFDPVWYADQRPNLALGAALADYMRYGHLGACSPSPLFDGGWYLDQHPELLLAGMDPLRHYLQHGQLEGANPNPEFDAQWYARTYLGSAERRAEALGHYLEEGAARGHAPNADFDPAAYLRAHPDLDLDECSPLEHHRRKRRLRPSIESPAQPAQAATAAPVARSTNSLRRLLAPLASLLRATPVSRALLRAFNHPRLSGLEQLQPTEVASVKAAFDPDFYLAANPDVEALGCNPLDHYLRHGWKELRDPSPDFSTRYYLAHAPDIAQAGINPFVHWVLHGAREKRPAIPFHRRLHAHDYQPLVSCIVPNYNHARFLEQRIRSIAEQSYPRLEIIILDDCSTDDSREVIRAQIAAFPERDFREAFNEQNAGNVFRQWRKGLELARGELVWICESDDFCAPDFVEKLVPYFADRSVQLGFGRIQFSNEDGSFREGLDHYRESAESGIWDQPLIRPAKAWFQNGFGVSNVIANVGGCLWRRQELDAATWEEAQNYRILGDWYLYSVIAGGGQIAWAPDAVAYFRQHGGNTSVQSFLGTDYYREHERFMQHLRSSWQIPESTVDRFAKNVEWQYQHHQVEKTQGPLQQHFCRSRLQEPGQPREHVLMAMLGFHPGGGEFFPLHLANALSNQGLRVSILALDLHEVNADMLAAVAPAIPVYDASYVAEVGASRFLQDAGVSLIHSHMISLEWFFFVRCQLQPKIPYLVTLHGSYESSQLSNKQLKLYTSLVSHWVYLADKNLEAFGGYREKMRGLSKLPNAMPRDEQAHPRTRQDLGIAENTVVFTMVARGIQRKGWRAIIQAFLRTRAAAPETPMHLLLAGEGELQQQQQQQHGDHRDISFLGFQSNIQGLFRLSDVAVVPTRFPGESFPLCIIEAFHAGVPVIATDIGEIAGMVSPSDAEPGGLLVPNIRDTEEFIAKLTQAMTTMLGAEPRRRLAQGARRLSNRYDMQQLAQDYAALYQTVSLSTENPAADR